MESSRRDLLNEMAENRPILKNNQNTYLLRFRFTLNKRRPPKKWPEHQCELGLGTELSLGYVCNHVKILDKTSNNWNLTHMRVKLVSLFLELFCVSGTRSSAKCVMAFRICHRSTCFVEKKRRKKNGVETERKRLLSYASCLKRCRTPKNKFFVFTV